MTNGVLPQESKKFINVLIWVSLVWFGLGFLVHFQSTEQVLAFTQIFLFSFLDLIFLILLFWNLFFNNADEKKRRTKAIRIMLFGFFKLVCLAFLAITLKRLRNASSSAQLMGVSIIWIGPIISGVYLKNFSKFKND
jgi:L-asparagine transporter-like permease